MPRGILEPTVTVYDPALASTEPWILTSVASGDFTFQGPYWLQIVDRAGRIVWYHEVPDGLFAFYPSVSFAGTDIWFDAEDIFGFGSGQPHVTRMSLDGRWSLSLDTPNAGQAFAEGPDDTFFFEDRGSTYGIDQVDPSGAIDEVWDCSAHMRSIGEPTYECLLNGCNWDPVRNTLLASQFESGTVFEVDLATGAAIRQMGQITRGDPYAFDPPTSMFAYQHWPIWTDAGTLLVSTHAPCPPQDGGCWEVSGQDGIQIAAEYAVEG